MLKWIYRKSDGTWLRGGRFEQPFDPATEAEAVLPDGPHPDPLTERFDPNAPTLRRAATADEMAVATAMATHDAQSTRWAYTDPLVRAIVTVLAQSGLVLTAPKEQVIQQIHAAMERQKE